MELGESLVSIPYRYYKSLCTGCGLVTKGEFQFLIGIINHEENYKRQREGYVSIPYRYYKS